MATCKASLKKTRISPRKLRLVADTIRGMDVRRATVTLQFIDKKGAPILAKVLKSAISNAVNNHGMQPNNLYISKLLINEGPTIKRFRPRAHGRACEILKRSSKVYMELSDSQEG